VALAAFVVSVAVAVYTVWRADKTASAGALISLQVALHDAWSRFLKEVSADGRLFEFAELLNLLETGCALYSNRSFTNVPRNLLEDYLVSVLKHLAGNDIARADLRSLAESPDTFTHIKEFELQHRASISLSNPLFIVV
jgi:hypothetical protein